MRLKRFDVIYFTRYLMLHWFKNKLYWRFGKL